MKTQTTYIILICLLLAVILFMGLSIHNSSEAPVSNSNDSNVINISTSTPTPTSNLTSKVKIALLAGPAKDGDQARMKGCDLVVMVERNVTPTTMPLTAAMNELFAKKEAWPYSESQSGSFISSQKDLFFDRATIELGIAKIYLKGTPSFASACDDHRVDTQVTETALQFSTVKSVQIFLNNQRWRVPSPYGV